MKLTQYQVDAFADRVFAGNPAAVVPLEDWLDDRLLQAIAEENNLAETAYFVRTGERFHLRWFTPTTEVDLCGHATLASAFVLFSAMGYGAGEIVFDTRSGPLTVRRDGEALVMDFPAQPPQPCEADFGQFEAALGARPVEILAGPDYFVVLESQAAVAALRPDMALLSKLDRRGVIVTAPGETVDFVSRFFAPKYGIPEDPVTGSAHCALAPYWSTKIGKTRLQARQISKRSGDVSCALRGDRVLLGGQAALFMVGEIRVR